VADKHNTPATASEDADEQSYLLRRLDRLDGRERAIVNLRYGLEGNAPMTLRDLGRLMGITREWVRKIELRAIRKMESEDPPMATIPDRGRRKLASRFHAVANAAPDDRPR